jgi:hypothetical protein
LDVKVLPYYWSVALSTSQPVADGNGNMVFDVSATADLAVPSQYSFTLDIFNGSQLVASCQNTTTCTATGVPVGGQYRAVVDGFSKEWGASSYDSFRVAPFPAMFAGVQDVCTEIAMIPGLPHLAGSSENDPALACEAGLAAGESVPQAIARAMAVGGAAVAAGLAVTSTVNWDPTQPTLPPPPPAAWPQQPPPTTLPPVWDAPVGQIAQSIRTLNPDAALSDADARTIARACGWIAELTLNPVSDCGKQGLPIFVSGSDTPAASQHDLDAILGLSGENPRPSWASLNYVNAANQIGSTGWYRNDPDCAGSGGDSGKDCDEFPYYSTVQGGRTAQPKPSLRPIASDDNQSQGTNLGGFYRKCGMVSGVQSADGNSIQGGDRFLVVPIPVLVPTVSLCNGKGP